MSCSLEEVCAAACRQVQLETHQLASFISQNQLSETQKRDHIRTFANRARTYLTRLLILTRFARNSLSLSQEKSASLQRAKKMQTVFRTAADQLYYAAEAVALAVLPPFDVHAAVDVLGSGVYMQLPDSVRAPEVSNYPSENETEQALRWLRGKLRDLRSSWQLPAGMEISELPGALLCSVEGEYQLWLTINFFQDASNSLQILRLRFLAGSGNVASNSNAPDHGVASFRDWNLQRVEAQKLLDDTPDQPMLVLHALLHSVCVSLSLKKVHAQAIALSLGVWSGRLDVSNTILDDGSITSVRLVFPLEFNASFNISGKVIEKASIEFKKHTSLGLLVEYEPPLPLHDERDTHRSLDIVLLGLENVEALLDSSSRAYMSARLLKVREEMEIAESVQKDEQPVLKLPLRSGVTLAHEPQVGRAVFVGAHANVVTKTAASCEPLGTKQLYDLVNVRIALIAAARTIGLFPYTGAVPPSSSPHLGTRVEMFYKISFSFLVRCTITIDAGNTPLVDYTLLSMKASAGSCATKRHLGEPTSIAESTHIGRVKLQGVDKFRSAAVSLENAVAESWHRLRHIMFEELFSHRRSNSDANDDTEYASIPCFNWCPSLSLTEHASNLLPAASRSPHVRISLLRDGSLKAIDAHAPRAQGVAQAGTSASGGNFMFIERGEGAIYHYKDLLPNAVNRLNLDLQATALVYLMVEGLRTDRVGNVALGGIEFRAATCSSLDVFHKGRHISIRFGNRIGNSDLDTSRESGSLLLDITVHVDGVQVEDERTLAAASQLQTSPSIFSLLSSLP